jgi:hypothetical protein
MRLSLGVYNFNIDLPNAEKITDLFEQLLKESGYTVQRAPNHYFPDWDVKATHPISGRIMTFEVKFDEMSSQTGNVAIEYECRGKPSGIKITKAICWVQYFDDAFHIVMTETLKTRIPIISFRDVTGVDPGSNTKMYLIEKDKFKAICNVTI